MRDIALCCAACPFCVYWKGKGETGDMTPVCLLGDLMEITAKTSVESGKGEVIGICTIKQLTIVQLC